MTNINSFADLIKGYGVKELRRDLNIAQYQTVWRWMDRDSIPPVYWNKVVVKARRKGIKVTLPMFERWRDVNNST